MDRDSAQRFELLLEYLKEDPQNTALAIDCAEAALAADLPGRAVEVLLPFGDPDSADATLRNLLGIAAMRNGDHPLAQVNFEQLLAECPNDPSLRFNLAWSRALDGKIEGARELLDEKVIEALPQAAMLELQLLHQTGEFDEAQGKLRQYLELHPSYPPLEAAASVLAMDLDDLELARECALRAGDQPDALATLGTIDLGEQRNEQAIAKFARSLATRSTNPRAHIGLGLAKLATQRPEEAAVHLDTGADQFGDHLGSWIAAGWAYCLAGDNSIARKRFEKAIAIDDSFAEAHGSLAVLDVLGGDLPSARRRAEIALRLDRRSFSAALASILIASSEGNAKVAKRLFEAAVSQPITHDGRTLLQALSASAI